MDASRHLDCAVLQGFIRLQRGHAGPFCCGDCHASHALETGRMAEGLEYALCCRMVRWLDAYKPGWRDGAGL
jgi:hypothetical protein